MQLLSQLNDGRDDALNTFVFQLFYQIAVDFNVVEEVFLQKGQGSVPHRKIVYINFNAGVFQLIKGVYVIFRLRKLGVLCNLHSEGVGINIGVAHRLNKPLPEIFVCN